MFPSLRAQPEKRIHKKGICMIYLINNQHFHCKVSKSLQTCCYPLVSKSCPTFLRPHGLQHARLLCPWDFPGNNTGVCCHYLLQEIFPTQGLNQDCLHCRQISLPLSHWGRSISKKLHLDILECPKLEHKLGPLSLFSDSVIGIILLIVHGKKKTVKLLETALCLILNI